VAFPTIPTAAAGRVLSNVQANTTATRTFPSLTGLTKNSGDLLIAIVVAYQTSTGTNAAFSGWTAGWTEFHDSATSTTMAIGMAYKWSTGSETGTIAVTQAATITGHAAMFLLSIPGAHPTTPPEAGGRASGTSAAANPTSLDPAGWGSEDTLWIAVGANGEDATTGSFTGVASPGPTNYTDYAESGISGDVVGGVEAAVAFRQIAAASEDVGVWSVDLSNARNAAVVIAVPPAPVPLSRLWPMNVTPDGTALTTSNILAEDGAAATVANAGAGGTLQSSTTQVHAGDTSMRHVGGGTAVGQCRLPFPGVGSNKAATSFYYYPDPTLTSLDFAHVRRVGGQLWRIAMTAAGVVQAKNSAGTVLGSTASGALATGRQNRIEAKWDNSGGVGAGTLDIEVFDRDGTTPTGTLNLTGLDIGTAATTDLEILSPSTSSFAGTHYFDSIQMKSETTTFIGPYIVATAGTLDVSVPKVTGSSSGTVDIAGTLDAPVAEVTGSMSGTVDVSGSLSASVPKVTGAASGTVDIAGTLDASVPEITGSITEEEVGVVTGTLDATLPEITGSATGTVDIAGTMSATLPEITGSSTGTMAVAGTLAASLPEVTGSAAGIVDIAGTLSASVPGLFVSVIEETGTVAGTLAVSVPKVTGDLDGTISVDGSLSATVPEVTGASLGALQIAGGMSTALPLATAVLGGTVSLTGTLTAVLPRITARLTTYEAPPTPWSLDVALAERDLTVTTPDRTIAVTTPRRTLEIS
jgi:hypothetical protein